ncbi:MAG: hypothetical protein QOE61_2398 [Micromonosporaceae bacterium]|jgi:hypothetical protein|nr:hypothetical protein [Micromonosporaceae bacterium]
MIHDGYVPPPQGHRAYDAGQPCERRRAALAATATGAPNVVAAGVISGMRGMGVSDPTTNKAEGQRDD